jgi:hypothetical protein
MGGIFGVLLNLSDGKKKLECYLAIGAPEMGLSINNAIFEGIPLSYDESHDVRIEGFEDNIFIYIDGVLKYHAMNISQEDYANIFDFGHIETWLVEGTTIANTWWDYVYLYTEYMGHHNISKNNKPDLYVTHEGDYVVLKWLPPRDAVGITSYNIYRTEKTNEQDYVLLATVTSTDVDGFVDTFYLDTLNIDPTVTYFYKVEFITEGIFTGFSDEKVASYFTVPGKVWEG